MTPKTYNIRDHWNGDSFKGLQFVLTDQNDAAIDLTGATIKCQFRDASDNTLILDLSIGSGITVDDAVNGTFTIDARNPFGLATGKYNYDVEVTYASGVIQTYIKGEVKILDDVTE